MAADGESARRAARTTRTAGGGVASVAPQPARAEQRIGQLEGTIEGEKREVRAVAPGYPEGPQDVRVGARWLLAADTRVRQHNHDQRDAVARGVGRSTARGARAKGVNVAAAAEVAQATATAAARAEVGRFQKGPRSHARRERRRKRDVCNVQLL